MDRANRFPWTSFRFKVSLNTLPTHTQTTPTIRKHILFNFTSYGLTFAEKKNQQQQQKNESNKLSNFVRCTRKKSKTKNIFSQSCLYLGNATCNWNGETAKLRTLVKQNTHTHTPIDHIIELHGLVYAMLCYPRLEISPILYVLVNKQKWKLYA